MSRIAEERPPVPSAFIVIPAYNEAKVIAATLAALPASLRGIDSVRVVVVDDGSTDGTADEVRKVVDPRLVLIRHALNRGLGGALGTGLAYARKEGADYVVTYDADGQHAPEDIDRVLEPILAGQAEAVVGSRLIDPKGMPWYRILGNWGLNLMTFMFFGLWTTDSQSGLRAFGRRAIETIDVRMDRMEVSSEFIKEIRRHRLKFAEAPIRAIYTDYSLEKGQSNWNAFTILFRLFVHGLLGD
jgi:glycosyltransferase involved in cell wall biosynthesis